MRRVSDSSGPIGSKELTRRLLLIRGFFAGVFVFAMMANTSIASFAADDTDGDEPGQLSLNTTVLVNESVRAGSTGEFPIRGRLFLAQLDAKAEELREAASERLRITESLDFARRQTDSIEYKAVRSELFEDYEPQEVPRMPHADAEATRALFWVVAAVALPLVLVGGVLLGKFWARRKG